jgi:glycosyltransferase involved in cell wall biosynthesis
LVKQSGYELPAAAETVCAVVLLTPLHVAHFVDFLIPNLRQLSRPFDELIIVASGLSRKSMKRIEFSLTHLPSAWHREIARFPLGSVGRNRNRGIARSESDLVTFIDSDDFFHPDYAEFILQAYARNSFHILMHGYSLFEPTASSLPEFSAIGNLSQVAYLSSEDFIKRLDIDWELDPRSLNNTNLLQKDETNFRPLHQGHMTLLRKFPLRFHENPYARNEDGVFLNQALLAGAEINGYEVEMSAYSQGTSAKPTIFRIIELVSRLSRKPTWRRRAGRFVAKTQGPL